MGNARGDIRVLLDHLQAETMSDFVALACTEEPEDLEMRWRYASGSRNERYKKMIFNRKGMIGNVLRSGRSVMIPSFYPKSGEDPGEYSILLAEGLKSVVAVPVMQGEKIKGVLLVGSRQTRVFTDELSKMLGAAEQLGDSLEKSKGGPR